MYITYIFIPITVFATKRYFFREERQVLLQHGHLRATLGRERLCEPGAARKPRQHPGLAAVGDGLALWMTVFLLLFGLRKTLLGDCMFCLFGFVDKS